MTPAPAAHDRDDASAEGWLGPRSLRGIDSSLVQPSRVVRWLKYGLPALAVVMAAVLLAWPHITFRIGAVEGKIDLQDNRLRMTDVRYEGKDESGRPYVLNAASGVETRNQPRELTLEQPRLEFKLDRGYVLARADKGLYYEADRRLVVLGNVQVNDPSGYEVRGPSATVYLKEGLILADEPVEGQGPLGLVYANAAAITEKGQHILLYRGVRTTLYQNPKGS